MLFFLSIYVFGIIGFFIHLYSLPAYARTKSKIIELLLLYQIVFSLGITSFVAFYGLTFMAEYVANYLQWPTCPFIQELANVNLAFGVLGILCIWYRGLFWSATVIGFSIWIISDGFQHLYHRIYVNENNPNMPLYTDFIVPIVLLVLLYLYWRDRKVEKVVQLPR